MGAASGSRPTYFYGSAAPWRLPKVCPNRHIEVAFDHHETRDLIENTRLMHGFDPDTELTGFSETLAFIVSSACLRRRIGTQRGRAAAAAGRHSVVPRPLAMRVLTDDLGQAVSYQVSYQWF